MGTVSGHQKVERALTDELSRDARLDTADIEVSVNDDAVILKGTVSSQFARQAAIDHARAMGGDRKVEDQLAISDPAASETPATEEIRLAVESVLDWLPDVEIRDRKVQVTDGVITIEGSVDALWKKAQTGEAVRNLYGAIDLEEKLTVVPTGSRLDHQIALDIEDALDRHARTSGEAITVKVEDGVVTLAGFVPDAAARNAALDIAAHTPGVTEIQDALSGNRESQKKPDQPPTR